MANNGTVDQPQVGRPTLAAVREPLARNLSEALYTAGQELLGLSRAVDHRRVEDYAGTARNIGAHLLGLVTLCGQLASIDEMEGGRMHGAGRATFPEQDPAVADQVEAFRQRRELEKTQRRARPAEAKEAYERMARDFQDGEEQP